MLLVAGSRRIELAISNRTSLQRLRSPMLRIKKIRKRADISLFFLRKKRVTTFSEYPSERNKKRHSEASNPFPMFLPVIIL